MNGKNISETACKYSDWLEESKVDKLQTIESLLNKTCLRSSSEIIDSTMQLNLGFWKCSLMGQFFFYSEWFWRSQFGGFSWTAQNNLRSKSVLECIMAQMVKNLPAMQEIRVQSLGREDPLEKGMATHSSILA